MARLTYQGIKTLLCGRFREGRKGLHSFQLEAEICGDAVRILQSLYSDLLQKRRSGLQNQTPLTLTSYKQKASRKLTAKKTTVKKKTAKYKTAKKYKNYQHKTEKHKKNVVRNQRKIMKLKLFFVVCFFFLSLCISSLVSGLSVEEEKKYGKEIFYQIALLSQSTTILLSRLYLHRISKSALSRLQPYRFPSP